MFGGCFKVWGLKEFGVLEGVQGVEVSEGLDGVGDLGCSGGKRFG